jgi:hypothetical protein
MNNRKTRGGWRNPASATNGQAGGRPREIATFRRGDTLILERIPIAIDPDHPFVPPERGVVLHVGTDEIEIQIGDDILTIRRPDDEP